MAASAGIVFTGNQGGVGDNTGGAAILDKHADFLPYIMQAEQQARAEKKLVLEKQRAADKAFKDAVIAVKPQATWQYAQGEIAQKANELRSDMVKYKMEGSDPLDPYSEAGQEVSKRKDELAALAYMAKDTEKKFNEILAERVKNPNAYDAEHFNKWMDGLKGKTIAEQAEYINSTNPLRPVIIDTEVVKNLMPDYFKHKEEQGLKTTDIQEIREEDFRPILESYLTTPEGEAQFEQGVEDGKWTDEDTYVKAMTEIAQGMKPKQTTITFDEPRSSGGGLSITTGGGGGSKKVDISSGYRDVEGLTKGVNKNVISVKRLGTQDDLPPIEVEDKGQLITFQPIDFVLGKDGKIGVRGKKVTKGSGMYSSDKEEEVWIDYDINAPKFEAQLGTDLYKEFENLNKTSEKQAGKTNTKFKGVPQGGF